MMVLSSIAGFLIAAGLMTFPEKPVAIDGGAFSVAGRVVTLEGVDVPNRTAECEDKGSSYRCGDEARLYLQGLLADPAVTCTVSRIDDSAYDCRSGNKDLGASVVRAGYGFILEGVGNRYEADQADAKQHRRGLWRGGFLNPALLKHPSGKNWVPIKILP